MLHALAERAGRAWPAGPTRTYSWTVLAFASASVLGYLAGYVSRLVLAHVVSPADLGAISAAVSVGTIATALATLGVDQAISQRLGAVRGRTRPSEAESRTLVRMAVLLVLAAAGLVSGVVFACALLLMPGSAPSRAAMLVVSIGVPGAALAAVTGAALQPLGQVRLSGMVRLAISRLLRVALLVTLILVRMVSVVTATGCFVAGDTAAAAIGLVALRRMRRRADAAAMPAEPGVRSQLWASARHLAPAGVLGQVQANFAVPLAALLAGSDQAGLLAGAYAVSTMLKALPFAVANALVPPVAAATERAEAGTANELYRAGARWVAYGLGPVVAVVLFMPGLVLRLTAGGAYTGAWLALDVLAAGMMVDALFGATGSLLIGLGETRWFLRAKVAATALGVLATLVLSRPLGALGGAIGITTAIMCEQALQSWHLWRLGRYHPFSARQAAWLGLCLVAVGSLSLFTRQWAPPAGMMR